MVLYCTCADFLDTVTEVTTKCEEEENEQNHAK